MADEKKFIEDDEPEKETGMPAEAIEDDDDDDEAAGDQAIFIEKKRSLFFGLPLSLTKYTVTPNLVTTDKGLINITEDDCYIYKISDVKLSRSFLERLFGLGTVLCYTADNTDPTLALMHVQHAKEIKSYIIKQSEIVRLKRRTFATQDITAKGVDVNGNGIPDFLE